MNRREFLKTLLGAVGIGAIVPLLKKDDDVLEYRGVRFVPAFNDEFSTRSWVAEKMEYVTLSWENTYGNRLWGKK